LGFISSPYTERLAEKRLQEKEDDIKKIKELYDYLKTKERPIEDSGGEASRTQYSTFSSKDYPPPNQYMEMPSSSGTRKPTLYSKLPLEIVLEILSHNGHS
jgi:hypothetical protein